LKGRAEELRCKRNAKGKEWREGDKDVKGINGRKRVRDYQKEGIVPV
jgi:hypothetical protein